MGCSFLGLQGVSAGLDGAEHPRRVQQPGGGGRPCSALARLFLLAQRAEEDACVFCVGDGLLSRFDLQDAGRKSRAGERIWIGARAKKLNQRRTQDLNGAIPLDSVEWDA